MSEDGGRPTHKAGGDGSKKDASLLNLNVELENLHRMAAEADIKRRRVRDIESDLSLHLDRLHDLDAALAKEEEDVDKLEGSNLTSMFVRVFGDLDSELEREKSEYFAAWLKHDQLGQTIADMRKDLRRLHEEIRVAGDVEVQRAAILHQKEKILTESDGRWAEVLAGLSEERANRTAQQKELEEAVREGFVLLDGLDSIINDLESAGGWGALDLLGGSLVTTAVKHSKIDSARGGVASVQLQLNRFRREMADVEMDTQLEIEIGSFSTFADFFFDGLIFDWVVQSRISRSLEQVKKTRTSVKRCLMQLKDRSEANRSRMLMLERERKTVIMNA